MPTAPVDNTGTVLYYEDSGAPAGSTDYVTLVLIHGTCFHGAVFRPLIPYAAKRNLRLILLNTRGYPGSTPYSADELGCLQGNRETREAALRSRGVELATFLRWLIETEQIPAKQVIPGSTWPVGGLSVLSWSSGNGTVFSLFAHANRLPDGTKEVLGAYLRSWILYDPGSAAVGNLPPPGIQNVFVNLQASLEEQALEFGIQAASYYPKWTLPNALSDIPTDPPRIALQDAPGALDPKYAPTILEPKMTMETFRSITHAPILDPSQYAIGSELFEAFAANVAPALYDHRIDSDGKKIWPDVGVHLVWCDRTVGEAAWAAAVLHCGYAQANPETRRHIEFHRLEDANHFPHWEEPEKFADCLAAIV